MYEYFISFTMSFIIAFSATPIAKKLAFKVGAVDVPGEARRMHKKPIARFGGLAIICGFFIAVMFNIAGYYLGITNTIIPDQRFIGMAAGAIIVIAVGTADDLWQLSAKIRLPFQITAAIVVAITGTRIETITNPFSNNGISNFSAYPFISYPLTILWIVGIINAINFIDGLDGLAAGVASIASLTLFFVSITRPDPDIFTAMIAAILAGSILGFLPYNFNPAKIFMADTGAPFLGFILAFLSIQGTYKSYTAIAFAVPLLVLAVPLFDFVFAVFRRLFNGKSIMQADRGHLHHRLVDMGLTQKQSVALIYAASAALGLCAIVLDYKGPLSAIMVIIALSVFIIGGAIYMNEINSGSNKYSVDADENLKKSNINKGLNLGGRKLDRIKVMTVFGTRPEAVKMGPLVKELEKYEQIDSKVCVTAQHREMLDQVLDMFEITPDHDLNIMKNRQTLVDITTRSLEGLSKVFEQEKPDIVLVHGDTTTTFVAGLAAFYKQISIGHVEAGLRTFDKYFPYPEEMNRKLTGTLCDLHFSPTATNKANLLNEGISENKIYITGNTVIDALKTTIRDDYEYQSEELKDIDFQGKRLITVTAHRRENLGEPLNNICRALKYIADKYEDVIIIYPVHLNPAVQEVASRILGMNNSVYLIHPLDVQDMHNLMAGSYMIMTDSGGLQEEAPSLGKPVLVLRNETERPEAVASGTVKLAGTDEDKIISLAVQLLDDPDEYNRMAKAVNPYGDGKASERIVKALLYEFGMRAEKPEEFKL
jgi:UDP-N-acetylglucosamine 2-epimerase